MRCSHVAERLGAGVRVYNCEPQPCLPRGPTTTPGRRRVARLLSLSASDNLSQTCGDELQIWSAANGVRQAHCALQLLRAQKLSLLAPVCVLLNNSLTAARGAQHYSVRRATCKMNRGIKSALTWHNSFWERDREWRLEIKLLRAIVSLWSALPEESIACVCVRSAEQYHIS